MKKLEIHQTFEVVGGDFWSGFLCGASVGLAIIDPTKATIVLAIGACGQMLQGDT